MADSSSNVYTEQDRGASDAYDRYLSSMDNSMRQKVALTAAHLLAEGHVADMGMGSGSGTLALASLYPKLRVSGVDINPEMVERARERHRLPNLDFVAGDIARRVFQKGSLKAILDSSVLHHVTSFNGYDHDAATRALAEQVEQLELGGSLIVRDFLDPGERTVLLDLPTTDGDDSQDPKRCSSAQLFRRFATEFRKLSEQRGFALEELPHSDGPVPAPKPGFARFRTSYKLAAEFVLRKDYKDDWDSEVLEEYTYFTQARFEACFAALGLRLLASTPLKNPWIVKHRFVDKFALWTEAGKRVEAPPTNYVIVGERVPDGQGVRFSEDEVTRPSGFLLSERYQKRGTEEFREVFLRPGLSIDIVPWFNVGASTFVLARKGHPRPVLQCNQRSRPLDGSSQVGYVTEPILAIQTDTPLGSLVEETLAQVAGISSPEVQGLEPGVRYFPSPGGLLEQVQSVLVEVAPTYVEQDIGNKSGFSTAGAVRAIDAQQLLRAAQVGGLPDARLELNVYRLLVAQRRDVGPWIGEELEPGPDVALQKRLSLAELTTRRRRAFERVHATATSFMELRAAHFIEHNRHGEALFRCPREFVLPRTLSTNTVACAVLARADGETWLGLDDDDLPAAQCFTGSSALWVAPAWRVPFDVGSLESAKSWVQTRLEETYGIELASLHELGGRYHPSAAVTPEVVYPLAAMVNREHPAASALYWVPLRALVQAAHALDDGHLRIVAQRAAHALGLLG